ncbi:MAG: LysR substrate-binding domain-containing protein [Solirubrobacterales bacterium]
MLLRQLEYLCALADARHFGRAAESCHVSQPALSVGIRKLESELGLELVRRSRRYDDLTPAGKELVTWARQILATSATFSTEASRLRGDLSGRLRLGVIPTALPVVAEITTPLLVEHPSIDLELRSLSATDVAAQIESFVIDAGVTYLDAQPPSGLRATEIFRERYAFLSAGTATGEETIAWRELDGARLCLLTPEMQNRRLVDAALDAAGVKTKVRIETDSISGLFSFAHSGWSSIVSEAWLNVYGVPEGTHARRLVDPDLSYPIGILSSDSDHLPPLSAALLRTAPLLLTGQPRRR